MWDPIWPALTAARHVIRVDLRGYGDSTEQPTGSWSARADVLEVLDHLGVERAHLVGCSFGAGVCAEIALERPELVASLVLAAPGGALLSERTDDFAAFVEAENAAVESGDLDAATEVNLTWWVDGPQRGPDVVPADLRQAVRTMQRQAFAITHGWPDSVWETEDEVTPEVTERLADIGAPTLVVSGELDLETVQLAADHLVSAVPNVRGVKWPDIAHLPPMERPADFATHVLEWAAAH